MRILIATDAWSPQVNGVVTTITNTVRELERLGHAVGMVTHEGFRTMPCPSYPEIRLAIAPGPRASRTVDAFEPDAVHIATEGPLGLAVRRHCLSAGMPFTTAFHTQFPEYVHARCRLPLAITYRWLRWFHDPAKAMMVPTPAIHRRLSKRDFGNLTHWSRGVDTERFAPAERDELSGQRPIFLCAGRVAVEKNIEAFLRLDLPGTKWVVGDGPARARLEIQFPDAVFQGMKHGDELAHCYQQADVLVFPSRTDTFGLVLIEAMACGTPVAAYPVSGPIDVVRDPTVGVLCDDLRGAALAALDLDRKAVRRYALGFSWAAATRQFVDNLHPATGVPLPPPPPPARRRRSAASGGFVSRRVRSRRGSAPVCSNGSLNVFQLAMQRCCPSKLLPVGRWFENNQDLVHFIEQIASTRDEPVDSPSDMVRLLKACAPPPGRERRHRPWPRKHRRRFPHSRPVATRRASPKNHACVSSSCLEFATRTTLEFEMGPAAEWRIP